MGWEIFKIALFTLWKNMVFILTIYNAQKNLNFAIFWVGTAHAQQIDKYEQLGAGLWEQSLYAPLHALA